mmetsp:Transcript_19221/g.24748  ORF Transcript_19221/g.24748 Transcript_19221/m.24748 type:complete len:464 (+) Transcript_19221:211-1602(+)|eukprot:CAMPEP_0198144880 /NCGR_PEP_ID=MMETSP1443-20131203/19170_1 /TAXON_ID=186043 /ORGANISM="Entomoneis sp., Strain CCMP2396" /LENGTH=463 /DNA_ID=CAMNT_0043808365 /DNA_START=129 /DNA_END=1520 /DNA_ORIENTATION=-
MPPRESSSNTDRVGDGSAISKDYSTVPVRDLNSLKESEISIEGVVYDFSNFDHPGGDSISLFGGQDATIQYKMIHPHHNKNTASARFAKMKTTGILPAYQPEYTFESPFSTELKEEVFKIVKRNEQFGTFGYFFRVFCFLGIFFYFHYLWAVQGSSISLAILYGVAAACIGTSVQHDANHGAASRRPWINELLGYSNDLLGNPKILWMQQHWTHHAHTNDVSRDPDSHGAEPFLLFYNYPSDSSKRRWYHKFQGFYLIAILSGFWAALFFSLDFSTMQKSSLKPPFRTDTLYMRKTYWMTQALHVYYRISFVLPPLIHHGLLSWKPFVHISFFAVSVSLCLGLLFTLSHNFEGVHAGDLSEKTKSDEPTCWYSRQVETSSTYGGFISGCFTGGLNFQIEHHLFPRMSSAWYPYIAPTVRRVCAKHGVHYTHFPWIWQNMWSTFQHVRKVGTGVLASPSKQKVI